MKPVQPELTLLDESFRISLIKEFQAELEAILSWWQLRMVDTDNGGFYGRIDGYNQLHPEAEKSIILNSRILWTFAAAARHTHDFGHKKMAERAFQYLLKHFVDPLEGGVFWMLNYRGEPVNTKKQIYAQAFTIYALSEYYLFTQNQQALETALEIFWLIEKYSFDKHTHGYLEAFSREWQDLADLRLSEKDANAAKTMNTHLHVLEAYTNLYRASPTEAVRLALKKLIECFLERLISPKTHHLHLFFDENWALQPSRISYGHDIECSWLLWEAAEVLEDKSLQKLVEPITVGMARVAFEEGLDTNNGLNNETSPNGDKDRDKHWWPQAEAVVGFYNAWQLSGETCYQKLALDCWGFIKKYLKDKSGGEWHWRVDSAEQPVLNEDKAGPWKAPYHNGRMCLEMIRRLQSG